jgi:hypothetical protein
MSDLDALHDVRLVFAQEPFTSLPLEIAVRDYFEPDLLRRFTSDEVFPPLKDLGELDIKRPIVEIQDIQPKTAEMDVVGVSVKVSDPDNALDKGEQGQATRGVYDLRLCCDGKLVGYAPNQPGKIPLQNGQALLEFDVPLSRHPRNVQFSAYAFNHDRVKSATATKTYSTNLPNTVRDRAYIVTVGVEKFESPAFRPLHYAPNDAKMILGTLTARLSEQSSNYAKVVSIPLISSDQTDPNLISPTKQNLKTVFDILAGRPVDPALLKGLTGDLVNQLGKSGPDDLIIVSFATHGRTDDQGRFYLFLSDTSSNEDPSQLLPYAVSSDELSEWFRDIIAAEFVLILDVCHSGAVAGKDFQPAPLGNRGLGQLAYEKGMRILAATQDDNDAISSGEKKHGLLTSALIDEGINRKGAADEFFHTSISLKDWLEFGRAEVPVLYRQLPRGKKVQRPLLLDFSQKESTRLIAFFYQ